MAEEGRHAAAQILGDMAAEVGYRLRGGAVIGVHGRTPFLRVEASGNCSRADEIAEQHCHVPPLSVSGRRGRRNDRGRFRVGGSCRRRDQRRTALRAEAGIGDDFCVAARAALGERLAAVAAKARANRIFGLTARAAHRTTNLSDDLKLN
jgi:hypothetical protein